MTFREKMRQMLYERGMFEAQIAAVMESVVADEANDPMRGRWDDHIEGYPPQMLAVLWLTVKRHALEFIEANCPQAWFKPLFEDGPAKDGRLTGEPDWSDDLLRA